MRVHADQDGHGRAQGRDLRQRQIDEDNAALDHVHAEISVNASQDQAGKKRQNEE